MFISFQTHRPRAFACFGLFGTLIHVVKCSPQKERSLSSRQTCYIKLIFYVNDSNYKTYIMIYVPQFANFISVVRLRDEHAIGRRKQKTVCIIPNMARISLGKVQVYLCEIQYFVFALF